MSTLESAVSTAGISPFFRVDGGEDEENFPSKERIFGNASELIGWTPLVETKIIARQENVLARLVVKLEGYQPGGSVKDRMALSMILDAEQKGLIVPGVTTILEATSGNTGIGLALVGRLRGYKVVLVMPSTASIERRMVARALGAEVVIAGGFKGFVNASKRLMASPNTYMLDQTCNFANPLAHVQSTGPEIWRDTLGKVDIFVAGSGTGGTLTGVGHYLKSRNPNIQVIGIEPSESPILSFADKDFPKMPPFLQVDGEPSDYRPLGYEATQHDIQGIGPNFIPQVTDRNIIDEIITVNTQEAYVHAQKLGLEEGLLVGISSGAAYCAALKVAKRPENEGRLIVVLLPSAGERYLSTPLFSEIRQECENMPVISE